MRDHPITRLPDSSYNPAHLEVSNVGLYSHYDSAHTHPLNRALHLIAIPLGLSSIVVVWFHWIVGLLLIPAALALATIGHLIEGNRPAFLSNPVHVLVAPVWLVTRIIGRRGGSNG